MENKFARSVAVLISVIMLFSAFSGATAWAETVPEVQATEQVLPEMDSSEVKPVVQGIAEVENAPVEKVESVIQRPSSAVIGEIEDEYGYGIESYTFTTFEDLKEMSANREDYHGGWDWIYMGSDPFVFEEDIDLSNITVRLNGMDATIPEGVTVSGAEHLCDAGLLLVEGCLCTDDWLSVDGKVKVTGSLHIPMNISVSGELSAEGAIDCNRLIVYGKMEVTGPLNLSGSIEVENDGKLIGAENIRLETEWSSIWHTIYVYNIEELKAVLEKANQSTIPQEGFTANFQMQEAVTLRESLTIPENCRMEVYEADGDSFTVAESVTLTINGSMQMCGNLLVEGTLENNNDFEMYVPSRGIMTLTAGGAYTGRGYFSVVADTDVLADVLVGFDFGKFKIVKDEDSVFDRWTLTNIDGLIKLATPTDLRWGYALDWVWNEESHTGVQTIVKGAPGTVFWKNEIPTQNAIEVYVYKVSESGDEYIYGLTYDLGSTEYNEYGWSDFLLTENLESGDYYFKVTSKGDGTMYADSDTAVSDIWHYVKPDKKMGDCSKPVWNWPEVNWTGPEGEVEYQAEWYYAENEGDESISIMDSLGILSPKEEFWDGVFYGAGYYSIRVHALSSNLEEYCHGEWSELSDPYYVSAPPQPFDEVLNGALWGDELSAEERISAIKELNTQKLADAMIWDNDVVDRIAQLEEETVGVAKVEVTEEVKVFDVPGVSVVGANLNNAADAEADIKLVVDKPEKEHVIPEAYHNAVAVRFSMNLENVEDPHNLEVPVEITLPIPVTMKPGFVVILHYDADGSYQEIYPSIFQIAGKYYAKFVVTGFSDFMMVSESNGLKGDINADSYVNDEDVILLLWHTLLPDLYPIEADGDINGDSYVNDEDVILLLWHTLLPDLYPI